MHKVSNEFLAVLLGKTTDEIAESLKPVVEGKELTEGETQAILEPLFKAKMNRQYHDGFNKAKAKGESNLTEAQKGLLEKFADKFGVELSDDVEAMFDAAVTKTKATTKAEGIKESDVTTHALYVKLKAESDRAIADSKAQFEAYKGETDYRQTLQQVKEKGLTILNSKNFDLPQDEAIRKNLVDAMFGQLTNGVKVQIANNEIVLCDAEGNVLKDDYGNPKTFDSHVENTAKGYFQFKQSGSQGSAGNQSQPPAGQSGKTYDGFNFAKPTNGNKGIMALRAITDPKEHKAFSDYLTDLSQSGELK